MSLSILSYTAPRMDKRLLSRLGSDAGTNVLRLRPNRISQIPPARIMPAPMNCQVPPPAGISNNFLPADNSVIIVSNPLNASREASNVTRTPIEAKQP